MSQLMFEKPLNVKTTNSSNSCGGECGCQPSFGLENTQTAYHSDTRLKVADTVAVSQGEGIADSRAIPAQTLYCGCGCGCSA